MPIISSTNTTYSNLEATVRTINVAENSSFGSTSDDRNIITIDGRAVFNEQIKLYDTIINNVPYTTLQSYILSANMPILSVIKPYNIVNLSESNANATGIVLPSTTTNGTIIKVQCRILAFGAGTNYINLFAYGWQDGSGTASERIYFNNNIRTSLRLQNGEFVELIKNTIESNNYSWIVTKHNGITGV